VVLRIRGDRLSRQSAWQVLKVAADREIYATAHPRARG
jgi:hypothetical protein